MTYEPSTRSQVNGSLDRPRFSTIRRDTPRTRRRTAPVVVRRIEDPPPPEPKPNRL